MYRKKHLFMFVTASLVCCISGCLPSKQKTETGNNPQWEQSSVAQVKEQDGKEAKGKEFVEAFYNGLDKMEIDHNDVVYGYIKKNATEHAINVLKDYYDYDCDGECLALWTLIYGEFSDPGEFLSRTISPKGGKLYLVENEYENYTNRIIIELADTDDGYKINDVKYTD